MLDPHRRQFPTERLDEEFVLEATANIESTMVEHARADMTLRKAREAVEQARAVERERLRVAFAERKRPLVAALKAALQKTQLANAELSRLQHAEDRLIGGTLWGRPTRLARVHRARLPPNAVARAGR